jgi:hypothetical protein
VTKIDFYDIVAKSKKFKPQRVCTNKYPKQKSYNEVFSFIQIFEIDGVNSLLYMPMNGVLCKITTLRGILFIKIALIFYAKKTMHLQ